MVSFECRKVIGFAFTTLRDWLKRFAPLFHPIRSKTKTNCFIASRALRQLHVTRITSRILPGPLLPWQPTFTLACIRVVYINKFVARHENLFYRKYCLEEKKKQRLIEKMISACVLISIIKLRLGFHIDCSQSPIFP